jgi:hypothetical protein
MQVFVTDKRKSKLFGGTEPFNRIRKLLITEVQERSALGIADALVCDDIYGPRLLRLTCSDRRFELVYACVVWHRLRGYRQRTESSW